MQTSFAELRSLMPATRSWVHLNAAAQGLFPTPVVDAMRGYLQEVETQGDVGFLNWLAQREKIHSDAAALLECQHSELAIVGSTSMGMHIAAEVLKRHGVRRIVTFEGEFPSTTLPWLKAGYSLAAVRPQPDGRYLMSDVERAATDPGVGGVAVSAVGFSSGFRVDLGELSELCRRRGIALCVNASQAMGQMPISLKTTPADFLASASHKWLFGGNGVGLLYVHPRWQDSANYPLAGWLSVDPRHAFAAFPGSRREASSPADWLSGAQWRDDAAALEIGSLAWVALYGLSAALAIHRRMDHRAVLAHNIRLARRLRDGLRRQGFTPTTPDDENCMSGICVVRVAGSPDEAVERLRAKRVVVSARGGGLRISTHCYNVPDDVDAFLAALAEARVEPPALEHPKST